MIQTASFQTKYAGRFEIRTQNQVLSSRPEEWRSYRSGKPLMWIASPDCNTIFITKIKNKWRGSRTAVLAQFFHNWNGRALITAVASHQSTRVTCNQKNKKRHSLKCYGPSHSRENLLLPEERHTPKNKVLRNMTMKIILCFEQLCLTEVWIEPV